MLFLSFNSILFLTFAQVIGDSAFGGDEEAFLRSIFDYSEENDYHYYNEDEIANSEDIVTLSKDENFQKNNNVKESLPEEKDNIIKGKEVEGPNQLATKSNKNSENSLSLSEQSPKEGYLSNDKITFQATNPEVSKYHLCIYITSDECRARSGFIYAPRAEKRDVTEETSVVDQICCMLPLAKQF